MMPRPTQSGRSVWGGGAEAIGRLRKDFDRHLRIEDLTREFGMSVSGFYYHFKAVTAMSPLKFQKQLRLQGLAA